MTTEQVNRITASLLRQMMFLKLLGVEQDFYMKQPIRGDIKQILARLKRGNENGLTDLLSKMPNDNLRIQKYLEASDEKIAAISNIIERLFVCTEDEVLGLEKDFGEHINVIYDSDAKL